MSTLKYGHKEEEIIVVVVVECSKVHYAMNHIMKFLAFNSHF